MCNSSRDGYFLSGAPLARTGIKRFDLAALLDFPSVIRPNESNPDGETTHFVAVWKLKRSYRHLFPHVSEWENVILGLMASRDGRGICNITVWPLCQFCFNACRTSWRLASGRWSTYGTYTRFPNTERHFNPPVGVLEICKECPHGQRRDENKPTKSRTLKSFTVERFASWRSSMF